jgi:hypothetical protein
MSKEDMAFRGKDRRCNDYRMHAGGGGGGVHGLTRRVAWEKGGWNVGDGGYMRPWGA